MVQTNETILKRIYFFMMISGKRSGSAVPLPSHSVLKDVDSSAVATYTFGENCELELKAKVVSVKTCPDTLPLDVIMKHLFAEQIDLEADTGGML